MSSLPLVKVNGRGGVVCHRGVGLQGPAHGSAGAGWVHGSVQVGVVAVAQLVSLAPLEVECEVS